MITIKILPPNSTYAVIVSPLPPSTFHLLLIVRSLPLRHQRAGANAVTTPLPGQRATADTPSTPPRQRAHPNANLQNPR
jgi:hypothetical protein